MILLDTDVMIEILDKKSKKGDEALDRISEQTEQAATTVINMHEILYGLNKYAKPVSTLLQMPVLNYTKRDAVLSARIELEAERGGTPIRRADSMIAAIAINNGAKLYSFDEKHFRPLHAMGLQLISPP